jgi:GntR family transcriptional regulator/MocR family aminotransferase
MSIIYTTPSRQFPTGVSLSLARRLALIDHAASTRAWIIEDDYDSELRYGAAPLPSLQSLDRSGCVIYTGPFSKVLFPSLRLGYVVVPESLVDRFIELKKAERSIHTSGAAVVSTQRGTRSFSICSRAPICRSRSKRATAG